MEGIGARGSGPYGIRRPVGLSCHPVGIPEAYRRSMDTSYCCPDCGDEHRDPAEATLGRQVRCLDCQIEIDLALEIRVIPIPLIAA